MEKSIATNRVVIIIVVIVIAIVAVLLWIQMNTFPPLEDMYPPGIGEPQPIIRIIAGNNVAATIKSNEVFAPSSDVKFTIGVKRSADIEEEKKYFNLCIGSIGEEGCTTPGPKTFETLGDDSGIKFVFSPTLRIDNRGDVKTGDATMQIPSGTELGIYGYAIYACAKTSVYDNCTGANDPDYYGMYAFNVTVE
jgi:hypothetical protein